MSIHYQSLFNCGFEICTGASRKPLSTCKGKLLSVGGRPVQDNNLLSNMVLYMIFFFQIPKGVLQRLDYFGSNFFRQSDNQKKKPRTIKMVLAYKIFRPKTPPYIGIVFLASDRGWWLETLMHNKYIGSKTLSHVYWKTRDSHYWEGLMVANKQFFHLPFGWVVDLVMGGQMVGQCLPCPRKISSLVPYLSCQKWYDCTCHEYIPAQYFF